jgi:hypothetical protein
MQHNRPSVASSLFLKSDFGHTFSCENLVSFITKEINENFQRKSE